MDIVADNDTSKMCKYLVKACAEESPDSEPKGELIRKIKTVIPRVASESYKDNVSSLMACIITIGEKALALKFLDVYLTSNPSVTPDAILQKLPAFVDSFGSNDVCASLLKAVN